MGGSSILAAAVLRCLGDLLGLNCTQEDLVYQVSQVEQILTAGGGWQDQVRMSAVVLFSSLLVWNGHLRVFIQVGAIYGGFKLGHSPAQLPLTVEVQSVTPSAAFLSAFESRVHLVYTGQQRLARNTLINALRKSALSPPAMQAMDTALSSGCVGTVQALISGAHEAWSILQSTQNVNTADEAHEQLDSLAAVLSRYILLSYLSYHHAAWSALTL
jgi:galactokinase/mevalonate kinase-like predicted kinase